MAQAHRGEKASRLTAELNVMGSKDNLARNIHQAFGRVEQLPLGWEVIKKGESIVWKKEMQPGVLRLSRTVGGLVKAEFSYITKGVVMAVHVDHQVGKFLNGAVMKEVSADEANKVLRELQQIGRFLTPATR